MDVKRKLVEARCRMLLKEPWYGHMAMQMVWEPSQMTWLPEARRTMGVRIKAEGIIECIYYEPFVERMTLKQTCGVVKHEIEHVVRLHIVRAGSRDPLGWNIAADMVVNGKKKNPRCFYDDEGVIVLPSKDMIFLPPDDKEWPETDTTEVIYEKLWKKVKEQGGFTIDGEGNVTGGGVSGKTVDDHDIWRQTEMSEDEARQLVKGMCDSATTNAGTQPGHLSEALQALSAPVVPWQRHLREFIGRHVGNKRNTYNRLNRRRQEFGVKGYSHHACGKGVIITDTSGSVQQHQFQMFFAEIDAVSSRLLPWVLQWDFSFQEFKRYRRGDWKDFQVKGRGGTNMEAPLIWLEENGQLGDINIMFTDGEVSKWPDERDYPMIFVIANSYSVDPPKWGTTILLEPRPKQRQGT